MSSRRRQGKIYAVPAPFAKMKSGIFILIPKREFISATSVTRKGNERTLVKRFNDIDNPGITSFNKVMKFKEPVRPPDEKDIEYHRAALKAGPAIEFLKKRGFNLSTIQHFKLGYANEYSKSEKRDREWVTTPYYEDSKLINIKYRSIPPEKKDFKRWKDAKSTLFNMDAIVDNHEIIITEGEFDAISCWQAGFKNVVSVPNGCSNFDPEWIDLLQNMETIYLWYDNDEKGNKYADELAPRLGLDRCKFIRIEGFKDANEYFLAHETLDLSVAKEKKIDNVIHFYDSVFQIFEHEKNILSEIKTPWKNVNKLLGPVEGGDLLTLSAVPKTGKTTLALNISVYNAKRGYPVLFYCLEMRPERLAKKIIEAEGRLTKETFTREAAMVAAQRLVNMPLYFGYNYKNIDKETVFQTIRAAARRFGLKLVVFDNLHYLIRSLAHVSAEVGNVTRSFKLLAEELHIPLILIAQPRKIEDGAVMTMNDLKDSSSIGADSDQVIILWRKKTKGSLTTQHDASFEPKTLVRVDASRYTAGGDTVLYCKGEYSQFAELERGGYEGYRDSLPGV